MWVLQGNRKKRLLQRLEISFQGRRWNRHPGNLEVLPSYFPGLLRRKKTILQIRSAMTLADQLSSSCIHFTGRQYKTCKAGVDYDTVSTKPLCLPCISKGGHCDKLHLPSKEEVSEQIKAIDAMTDKAINAHSNIKKHFSKTKERSGKLPCTCGGTVTYHIANGNDHIRAACDTCDLHIIE